MEFNRVKQQICDLNMEITLFLKKFQHYRQTYNMVDTTLIKNLEMVYEEIEGFLDSEPKSLKTNNMTEFDLNLERNKINRVFICEQCNMEIGERARDVIKHCTFHPKHKLYMDKPKVLSSTENKPNKTLDFKKSSAKAEQNTKSEQKKKKRLEQSRSLPKKAKSFLSSDYGDFLNKSMLLGNKLKMLPAYDEIQKNILTTIKPYYPNSKIHLFGSRINGLGSNDSDLDMFLEIGDIYNKAVYNASNNTEILKKLEKVKGVLNKKDWTNFETIKGARVPILRVFNSKERIDCDISFSNGLGQRNTILMKYFFELQPISQKMCIFVKKWLQVTTLKLQFSTYTLVLMVIFYLQTKKLLPPVKLLQKDIENPFEIGPWQADFIEKQLKELKIEKIQDSNVNTFLYLQKFFNFYGNTFNFQTSIVCPYLGFTIQKKTFDSTATIEMPRYSKYNINQAENSFQHDKPLCVQDPLELNHNVGKGISDGVLQIFQHYCVQTSIELKK